MKIGEVAQQSGIPSSTLRYYEEIGLVPQAERQSGQRVYQADILIYLKIIQLAKNSGFNLEEIKLLMAEADAHATQQSQWNDLAERKITEIATIIEQYKTMQKLLKHIIACQCLDIRECELIIAPE